MVLRKISKMVATGSPLLTWGDEGVRSEHDTIGLHGYLQLHVISGSLRLFLQRKLV